MRIGLVDIDSKIPNLALMKLASYHKSQAHDVEWYLPLFEYDKIYASKIFKFSEIPELPSHTIFGGSGVDPHKKLDPEIEKATPDYSIYPNINYDIGFAMRGCRFKCGFCLVPKMEGTPRGASSILGLMNNPNNRKKELYLLDNDFFGNPEWEQRLDELIEYKIRVCFSQGLNIRILSKRQVLKLAQTNYKDHKFNKRKLFFAWDSIKDEKVILRGIERCRQAGIKPAWMMFYVLIGYDSTHEENYYRTELLKKLGCDVFVMPYDKSDPYQSKFSRWANRKQLWKGCTWEDFRDGNYKPKQKYVQYGLQF